MTEASASETAMSASERAWLVPSLATSARCSKTRPALYRRTFRTDRDVYDERHVGWKVKVLESAPDPRGMSPVEFREVYDTSKPGRSNAGHTYGDGLSAADRMAVIEYLKTL